MTNKKKKYYKSEIINLIDSFSYDYFFYNIKPTKKMIANQYCNQTGVEPVNISTAFFEKMIGIAFDIDNTRIYGWAIHQNGTTEIEAITE